MAEGSRRRVRCRAMADARRRSHEDIRRRSSSRSSTCRPTGGSPSSSGGRSSGNRYLCHLFAIPLGSKRAIPAPRQLTAGTIRDTRPRICPDGHTLAFVRTDPTDDDPVPAIHEPRTFERGRPAQLAKVGRIEVGESPGRPTAGARLHRGGRPAALHRRQDPTDLAARQVGADDARSPATSPGPTGDGTRRAIATGGRTCSSSSRPRRGRARSRAATGASPTSPGIPTAERSRSPPTAAGARPPLADDDLGGRCRWGDGAEAREVPDLPAAGRAIRRGLSRRRWIAASGVLEPEPLDDVIPGVVVGPADGRGAVAARPGPRPADRQLDRHRPDRLVRRWATRPVLARRPSGSWR